MRIVLRIGGSVIASPINPGLIMQYVALLKDLRRQGHEVAVVVGGGALAREFIRVAKQMKLHEEAQDRVAISVSRLFAQLFIEELGDIGCGAVPLTIEDAAEGLSKGKVAVMGGLKPGMTTDTVAALIVKKVKADLLVKASDQEGVYNKDPKKHSDAAKFDHLTFETLAQVFTKDKHEAGIHQILDPEALRVLQRGKVKVIVVNGFNPKNVVMAVDGKRVGTLID
jgi:uridylate kinase